MLAKQKLKKVRGTNMHYEIKFSLLQTVSLLPGLFIFCECKSIWCKHRIAASVAEVLPCVLTNNMASHHLYSNALLPMPHLTAMLWTLAVMQLSESADIDSQTRK
ncbi:MAG: hypothetical protein EOO06_20765 [Chitinophagaceae bacterium]|nr:MAG: hypothetical protein EOO06_20765 [Chitinophagaceae bacterium]